jgi:hypothetical protein
MCFLLSLQDSLYLLGEMPSSLIVYRFAARSAWLSFRRSRSFILALWS